MTIRSSQSRSSSPSSSTHGRFPTCLVFRFVAIDLDEHGAAAESASTGRGPALAAAGRDYAALVRHLSRTVVLLELHVYLVVGLEGAHGFVLCSLLAPLSGLLRMIRRGRTAEDGPSETELLDRRGEQVALAFEAISARPRRLDNVEIAELLYTCWCPERARRHPLQVQRRAA